MPLIFLLTKNTPRSNFKISSIMKQSEFLSLKMIANILDHFNKECEISKEFGELPAEHALFYDSCNVIQLKREILDLTKFLRAADDYSKIAERG